LEQVGLTSREAEDESGSFEVRLPPQPSSVAEARGHVRALLRRTGRDDLADTATLLVSEVVTNALLHAGTDIDLGGSVDAEGLRVSVGDGSMHMPSRRRYATTAGTGRGLLMLESMVDDWGVTQHVSGKTVWFELSHADGSDSPVEPSTRVRRNRAESGSVPVQLHNMPLLLHAAWQEHAEGLLREYLLANLDTEDEGEDPIQMHADATDAIAVLEEHVPHTEVAMATDALMEGATEPLVSAERLDVPVPLESVPHFETLDRAIEAALDLSREGMVLTPPTQPEVQLFRRWLCQQVLRQAEGGAPVPWEVPPSDRAPSELPPDWDPSTVVESAEAVVAADHGSRILAVSRPALALLGYDDQADLVGTRIVSIVPERYRQAHVAGFTMYLLVGRRPLLDRPVVIPALRRDGSEVMVELLVRDEVTGPGRSVLVARMRVPA
jgi:PAS domain S-box-containing protein